MNRAYIRPALIIALVVLAIPTIAAFLVDGPLSFPNAIVASWASIQIYIDLVIAILIFLVWLHRDAKEAGRNPWPWIIASLIVGSFAPLLYLLLYKSDAKVS